uniref:Uncharacterized protein n=1 Tax=Rhizophora mucronata TaxID=61149 RepID=A0A2P2J415_RHIMU
MQLCIHPGDNLAAELAEKGKVRIKKQYTSFIILLMLYRPQRFSNGFCNFTLLIHVSIVLQLHI